MKLSGKVSIKIAFFVLLSSGVLSISFILESQATPLIEKTNVGKNLIRISSDSIPLIDVQLIENTDICLSNCYAILKFHPYEDIQIPDSADSEFKWEFVKEDPEMKGLESYNFEIISNVSYYVSIPTYEEVAHKTTCYNSDNSSYECTKWVMEETGYNNEIRYKYEFKPFSFWGTTLKVGEDYIIKLTGKKHAVLGKNNIDWMPTIRGVLIDDWALWYSNWSYRQPLTVNHTGTGAISDAVILINGTVYINTEGLISEGRLDENCDCLRFTDEDGDEIYWDFENESSSTYGCNTPETVIHVKTNVNATDYMYYDASCGVSETSYENKSYVWDKNDYLVAYLFGEEQGATAHDYSGNGYDVTANQSGDQNNAWNDSGKVGYGIYIDQNKSHVFYREGNSDFQFPYNTTSWTITMWIKLDIDPTNADCLWAYDDTTEWYGIRADFYSNKVRFIWNDVGVYQIVSSDGAITKDWEFLAFRYNHSGTKMEMFRNGTKQNGSDTTSSNYYSSGTEKLIIGEDIYSFYGNGGVNRVIDGKIDQFAWHEKALSDDEIKRMYDIGLSELGTEEEYPENAANESEGDSAIEDGIVDSIVGSSATIYDEQQIYIRYENGSQELGTFDKVAIYGNQTWAFNYVTENESNTGMYNLSSVVFIWEMTNISQVEISTQVGNIINETYVG